MAHRYTAFKKINKPGRYSKENTINDITPELNQGAWFSSTTGVTKAAVLNTDFIFKVAFPFAQPNLRAASI